MQSAMVRDVFLVSDGSFDLHHTLWCWIGLLSFIKWESQEQNGEVVCPHTVPWCPEA